MNNKKIKKVGLILSTITDEREKMVNTIQAFPSTKKANEITDGSLVLLYNTKQNYFFAQARLKEIVKLSSMEKNALKNNYPKAYNEEWKYNFLLYDYKLLTYKFTVDELNYYSKKASYKTGYPLGKSGSILYIDIYDIKVLPKLKIIV